LANKRQVELEENRAANVEKEAILKAKYAAAELN